MVKKYDLPPQKDKKVTFGDTGTAEGTVRQGLARMGTWTAKKPDDDSTSPAPKDGDTMRRMSAWTGFGGKKEDETDPTKKSARRAKDDEDDDDRRIRFTIGNAGRRLTKDDFLKELQQLDPKARQKIVESSDAPADMKEMARKDADDSSPGSSRLFGARNPQVTAGQKEATMLGAKMAQDRGASVGSDRSPGASREPTGRRTLEKIESRDSLEGEEETAAERRRREQVLKGVADGSRSNSVSQSNSGVNSDEDEPATAADRRRATAMAGRPRPSEDKDGATSPTGETPAERRRREAALGIFGGAGQDSDSEDDNTERVPRAKEKQREEEVPAARRGIRFAEDPVRGRK